MVVCVVIILIFVSCNIICFVVFYTFVVPQLSISLFGTIVSI
jgi:hypothetical protein